MNQEGCVNLLGRRIAYSGEVKILEEIAIYRPSLLKGSGCVAVDSILFKKSTCFFTTISVSFSLLQLESE